MEEYLTEITEKGLFLYKNKQQIFIPAEEIEKRFREIQSNQEEISEEKIEPIIQYFKDNYDGKLIKSSADNKNVFIFEIDKYYDVDSLFSAIKDIYYKNTEKSENLIIRLEIGKYKENICLKFYLDGEESIEPIYFESKTIEEIIKAIYTFKCDVVTRLLIRVLHKNIERIFKILSKSFYNDLEYHKVKDALKISLEVNQALYEFGCKE